MNWMECLGLSASNLLSGGGWRKKRPNENETEVRYEGRNGRAQGRRGAPKTRSRSTKNAVGMENAAGFFFFCSWDEKWMETARQNLQPEQLLKSKQEPAYSLIPFLIKVGEIIWNILNRWAVMFIYGIKEVSGDFTDSLSNSGNIKVSSKIDISHIPMGIENLSYDYIPRAFE
ncbi:hypothetical protein TNCV_802931 [Trichonephila clavipes]|nr:hypothetical protein TNCV_802931 [Trichonephila clavipes]